MATVAIPSIGAPPGFGDDWDAIEWRKVFREVRRLQMRIAKAVREKRYGRAKALQRLLTHSFAAKLWAVRRVVRNRGSRTPGVDGVVWRTPRQKMQAVRSLRRRGYRAQPLRRTYIAKKNGKRRPLSIPTKRDRAMQALHLLALNPIAETQADPNSYGFRLERSTADALGQCFIALAKSYSAQWIFEGDIASCFDRISHPWLAANIPMDGAILRQWLAAGYMEEGVVHPTEGGTPQGGIASPVLANLTLDGLERVAREAVPSRSKVNVIRYADDFIITASSRELLETRIIPAVTAFLAERGLELSKEKSRITHIADGFDFLGATLRKYRGKLLMTPSRASVLSFTRRLRDVIKGHRGRTAADLIKVLNRKLRGWTLYFRHLVSSRIFRKVDHCVVKALGHWMRHRHPTKSWRWRRAQHYRHDPTRGGWVFTATSRSKSGQVFRHDLFRASRVPIRRHVKVRAAATVFDPEYREYFLRRWMRMSSRRARQRLAETVW
jgi:RNA-directed DNA polymerase